MADPVLFIGLGGTGTRIVTRIKQALYEISSRPGGVGWDEINKVVHFYGIDTCDQDEGVTLDAHKEFVSLSGGTGQVLGSTMVQTLLDDSAFPEYAAYFKETWHKESSGAFHRPGIDFEDGAGQERRYGRLCLDYWIFREGMFPLTDKIIADLVNAEQKSFGDEKISGNGATAYVFGSLCGGTSSGIAIDIAEILKNRCNDRISRVFGVFILPSVFQKEAASNHTIKEQMDRIRANNAAAMKEILYYSQSDHGYHRVWPISGGTLDARTPPFTCLFLVGPEKVTTKGEKNVHDLGGLADAEELVANFYSAMYSSKAALTYAMGLVNVIADEIGKDRQVLFGRIGHLRIRLAIERITRACLGETVSRLRRELSEGDGSASDEALAAVIKAFSEAKGEDGEKLGVDLRNLSEDVAWLQNEDEKLGRDRLGAQPSKDEFPRVVLKKKEALVNRANALSERLDKAWERRRDACKTILHNKIMNLIQQGPDGYRAAGGMLKALRREVRKELDELDEVIGAVDLDGEGERLKILIDNWLEHYRGRFFGLGAHPEDAVDEANRWLENYWRLHYIHLENEANRDFLNQLQEHLEFLLPGMGKMDEEIQKAADRLSEWAAEARRSNRFTEEIPENPHEMRTYVEDVFEKNPSLPKDLYTAWLSGKVDEQAFSGFEGAARGLEVRIKRLFAQRKGVAHPDGVMEDLAGDLMRIGDAFGDHEIYEILADKTLLGEVARREANRVSEETGTAQERCERWLRERTSRADVYGRLHRGGAKARASTIYADRTRLETFQKVLEFSSLEEAKTALKSWPGTQRAPDWTFCDVEHEGACHELVLHQHEYALKAGADAFPDYHDADPKIFQDPWHFTDRRFPRMLRMSDTSAQRMAHLIGLAAEWEGVIKGKKGASMKERKSMGPIYTFLPHLEVKKTRLGEARAECYARLEKDDEDICGKLREKLRAKFADRSPNERQAEWQEIRDHLAGWHEGARDESLKKLLKQQILYVEELLTNETLLNDFFRNL